jgi:hypothetical protein
MQFCVFLCKPININFQPDTDEKSDLKNSVLDYHQPRNHQASHKASTRQARKDTDKNLTGVPVGPGSHSAWHIRRRSSS